MRTGIRHYLAAVVVEPPVVLSLTGDGALNFPLKLVTGSGGIQRLSVSSFIYAEDGTDLSTLNWWWEIYDEHQDMVIEDANFNGGTYDYLEFIESVAGISKYRARFIIGGNTAILSNGNTHVRFLVTDGVTTHKSKARLYDTDSPNYDSTWDTVEPTWVQGNTYVYQSAIYDQNGAT